MVLGALHPLMRGQAEIVVDVMAVLVLAGRVHDPGDMAKAKAEPADYAQAMTDFASATAEVAAENMAAFAEIAKKVQMDTVELMMAAGKDMSEDAASAMKKATTEVTAAAKKATAK